MFLYICCLSLQKEKGKNAEILQKTIDIRLWELFVELLQTVCQMIEKDIDDVMELIMRKPEFERWVENIFSTCYKQAC